MFQRFTMGAALAGLALAAGASGGAHAEEKAAFTIDVASLYTNLQASFGPPFAPNADLDGVDGPDATQANIVLFNSVASDVGNPTHDQLHDAWIDNFLLARDTMRDHTALANSVINDIAAIIGLFMAIQTHAMEHAMEDLWEDELGITAVEFDSLPWVQAPFFADDDDDDHHHDDDDHHHDDDDHHHHHHGGSTIKYYQPIGGNLIVRIPGGVDTSQPIQWYHNGVPMQDYLGLIVGTQSRELELYALEIEQSGAYHVTYTAGDEDDDDHHHDDDDHHHDDDDHHHDEDDHDHDHKSAKDGDDVFYFIIQVVDPASLPVSNPYLLIALTVLFAVGGAVAFRRLRNA